jgi:hypothetical protein
MPRSSAKLRSFAGRLGLLAVLCLGMLSASAQAQGEAPVFYFKERTFEIPFEVDSSRPVRQFFLYASTDGKSYARVAAAAPNSADKFFTYTAAGDGWYYFIVQVEDLEGRFTPANVNNLVPAGLKVCVDTTRPTATLKPVVPQAPHAAAVEWEVSDVNLDINSLKLRYAVQGSDRWTSLDITKLAHAQFSWTPPGAGPFDVQVEISDRAGNVSTATTRVGPGAAAAAGGAAAATTNTQRVIHVRSKTFKLNYKCDNKGPSGVKRVEIWWTRDTSQWTLFVQSAPPEGPFELKVPAAGRFGFTLRPINGVGRGPEAPVPRQLPHVWIEVDEIAPQVVLHNIVVGEGKDSGFFIVNWQATDKWFRARPITISYSSSPEGPWTAVQAELENTGTCRLPTRGLPFEFYLQVKAIDEAGNEGYAVSKEAVKVDLQIPKVVDIDVVGVAVDGGKQ